MARADNYSLLLLAGGKSSRMGTNKAELLYEGRTFIENLMEKAKAFFKGELLWYMLYLPLITAG